MRLSFNKSKLTLMMNEEVNMDKAFREKFDNFTAEPPGDIWNNINSQLNYKHKKINMHWYSLVAAAAALILALMAGWYFTRTPDDRLIETAGIETDRFRERSNVVESKVAGEESISEMSVINTEIPVVHLAASTSNMSDPNKTAGYGKIEGTETGEAFKAFRESGMQLIDNLKAVFHTDNEDLVAEVRSKREKEAGYEQFERELIAENVTLGKSIALENNANWKMGFNISPGYSSYSARHASNYSSSMTYADNGGNGNVSGGLALQYKAGKRWSIETGVYYAQNGQKSESSPQSFAVYDESYNTVATTERLYFNPEVKVSDDRISMNSIAGIIDFDNVPRGTEIAANLEKTDNYSGVLLTSGEFSQVFDFVEIPLYLRYMLVDSKIDIEVLGGVNTGFVVGNNAYIKNEYGEQNIGKTRDISTVNLSGTVGVGVTYALSKNVSLALEPRLNYYLHSINNSPDVEFRPYRIGIYTGLYYEF